MDKSRHDTYEVVVLLVLKAVSTPLAELSGADDVNKTREGRETQKTSPGRVLLLGLPHLPRLVDVISAGNLGSWCGFSLMLFYRLSMLSG